MKYLLVSLALLSVLACNKHRQFFDETTLFSLNLEFDEEVTADEKRDILLHEQLGVKTETYAAKAWRRGGYSMRFPKHSYSIDLYDDVPLANLPADDDWILNANYIDKTFLRHVISYELFQDMGADRVAPNTRYVELELNGVYNGLYVLMEKLDKSTLGIDANDSAAVIFKEPHIFRESYDGIIPEEPENFHQQKFPKIEERDMTAYIESVRNFILESSDEEFTQQIANFFDLENVIDWHLLLLITNNSDGILKGFYLYKINEETPLRIAPWDYDHSFGRDGDNELNLDARPLDINRSILFARLLGFEWYKKMLKTRWNALQKEGLLNMQGLKWRIHYQKEKIKPWVAKNFELWPVDASWYFDDNGFEEEIQIMYQFVELRHHRLTEYFSNL